MNKSRQTRTLVLSDKTRHTRINVPLTWLWLGADPAALSPVVQPREELLIISHVLPALHLHSIGGGSTTVANLASVLGADLAALELRRCCKEREAACAPSPSFGQKVARANFHPEIC